CPGRSHLLRARTLRRIDLQLRVPAHSGAVADEGLRSMYPHQLFPAAAPSEVERMVELRLLRQSTLAGADPSSLEVVVDEAALHRLPGGHEGMRAQLPPLVEIADREGV